METFDSFSIAPCPKGTVNVAVNQLAQAAIASHLAGDASSSSAGASTSGAIDNVTEHAGIADDSRRVTKEYCLICLDDKTSSEMATLKKCRHKFCVACMQKHAEVQVQVNQVPVRCPQAACSEVLEYPDECKKHLTQEIFSIVTKRFIEAKVLEGDRVYCPYANCSTLMDKSGLNIPEQGNSSTAASSSLYQKVECVACLRSFCLDCRVPWHWNRFCQEYQNLPPDQRDAEESNLYKLAKNQEWQRCKKCRRIIELAEGCYHMTCRCGYEFCYTCGTEWKHKRQQCQCNLWDERNIVPTPLDSDDESDDKDFVEDEQMEEELEREERFRRFESKI
ncbi:hypothetical protein KC19_4G266200 [Ceratodon purpureus]|uniref:RBR-type E3 ubiquitin transferase n=1 Tax=Ceratodon purpureus TaxID=3225 RepID=A0A8T0IFK7_CERPU|nr:hypothetical protein KC19_4G266200 [Ceratodon purpureus]